MGDRHAYWDAVYSKKSPTEVSWYEASPTRSLELIKRAGLPPSAPIIDIGGGASTLVDELLARGHLDVTVVDAAQMALDIVAQRTRDLRPKGSAVHLEVADVTAFEPRRRFSLWHDRAVFHFLTTAADQAAYRRVLLAALADDGTAVLMTFAEGGPETCSGLPVTRWSEAALAAFFAPELSLIESGRDVHTTPWGALQAFTWVRLARRAVHMP